MTAALAMSDSATAMWRLPTKSYFVPCGMRSKVLNRIRRSGAPYHGA